MPISSGPAELFTLFTERLDGLGVDYMVTGSVATILYGTPRLTHDIDLVVRLGAADAARFVAAFPEEDFYCAPADIVRIEALRPQRGHFNVIHHETGFKADVYLFGNDPLHRWAFKNINRVSLGDRGLNVAPPEYVLLRKLEYHREGGSQKHIDDIRGLLATTPVDRDFIARWVAAIGLESAWALAAAP